METDATIPLPFLPLQAFPPGLTSLTPRQPAKYLNLFASFFSLFLGKVKVFLVALSSSLSRDYYKHLSGPLLVFGVAWLSQAFCCSNIAAKISVNASTFKQSLLLLEYGPCFFLGLGKGKNRMQAFRVHIADQ